MKAVLLLGEFTEAFVQKLQRCKKNEFSPLFYLSGIMTPAWILPGCKLPHIGGNWCQSQPALEASSAKQQKENTLWIMDWEDENKSKLNK